MAGDIRHIGDGRRLRTTAEKAVDRSRAKQGQKGDEDVHVTLLQGEHRAEQQRGYDGADQSRQDNRTPPPRLIGKPAPA